MDHQPTAVAPVQSLNDTVPEPPIVKRGLNYAMVHLPELLIAVLLLMVVLGAIMTLVSNGIESLGAPAKTAADESQLYGASLADYTSVESLSAIATLAIALPLFIWLFMRVKHYENDNPLTTCGIWRRAILGLFIVSETMALVWTLVSTTFSLLAKATGLNTNFYFFSLENSDPWWVVLLIGIINSALLSVAIWFILRLYKGRK